MPSIAYFTSLIATYPIRFYNSSNGCFVFRIQSIPFLLELRSVLDWVCTDTTLSLSHWLKMEDIYANIYILKCWRDSEKVSFLLFQTYMALSNFLH